MKILFTSDLHGNKALYEQWVKMADLQKPDWVILGGDLLPKSEGRSTLLEVQKKFAKKDLAHYTFQVAKTGAKVALMFGNDDCEAAAQYFNPPKGVANIGGRCVRIRPGLVLCGFSYVSPTPFNLKDWERLEFPDSYLPPQPSTALVSKSRGFIEMPVKKWFQSKPSLEEELNKIKVPAEGKWIFVSHAPPYGTNLDQLRDHSHVGSKAILKFILKNQPICSFHGHIHESYLSSGNYFSKIGRTLSFCSGQVHSPALDAVIMEDIERLPECGFSHTGGHGSMSSEGLSMLRPPLKK